ncbi:hypothetical protein ACFDR9_004568 [Janthinobacterium sp. CG_23.3]|uniref:hypothetical protein n=1 Tax=Janthinobacterium sp. CG_23.3 TaxID=3349634 RepID=UPI0038D494F7
MKQHQPHKPTQQRRLRNGAYAIAAVAILAGVGIAALALPRDPARAAAPVAASAQPGAATPGAVAPALAAPSVFPLSPFGRLNAAGPKRLAAAEPVAGPQAQRKAELAAYETMEMPADFVPVSADGATENAPFARIRLAEFSSGQRAIDLLGADLAPVANWYGMTAASLSQLLLSDASVHLDRKGRIVHIDEGVGATAGGATAEATTAATGTATAAGTPFPLDQTFKLHTKPDSTRVLFIDFNGQGANPGFDLDKVAATYSTAERLLIQKVWQRVAEDFAAFDVDVTTEAPAVVAGKIGATVLVTPQASSAGGYAYLNSFAAFAANAAPAFCFPNNLANSEKPIAECVSHEAGHTLGLRHQGTAATAYYTGHGDGQTGWAPIMGVGYYKNLTQWSKGQYLSADNKEDAYAVMARQGLKARVDDHGGAPALATTLTGVNANGLSNLNFGGLVGVPGDVDMFRFVAGAGMLTLKAAGAALGSNVDILLQVYDGAGRLLASANPVDGLDASLSVNLALPGTYYVSVTGAGVGDPLKTGYTNYGSIGRYSVSASAALALPSLKLAAAPTR